jgi:hypothetical protein
MTRVASPPHRYREVHEVDGGYRFYRDNCSILVRATAYGRRLTNEEMANFTRAINRYTDTLNSIDAPFATFRDPIVESEFADYSGEPLYKYVSDSTWQYISKGSFQLGTAKYYRETRNINAQDRREGEAMFHLVDGEDQLNVGIVSGLNCALFCGTSFSDGPDHQLMLAKFGARRIRIDPLADFVSIIRRHIGAFAARTHDIVYTDLKSFVADEPSIPRFKEISFSGGTSDDNPRKLHKINKAFFSTFYKYGFMPSLFTKPTSYREEKERRVVFETMADLKNPTIVINDKSLLDCVQLID